MKKVYARINYNKFKKFIHKILHEFLQKNTKNKLPIELNRNKKKKKRKKNNCISRNNSSEFTPLKKDYDSTSSGFESDITESSVINQFESPNKYKLLQLDAEEPIQKPIQLQHQKHRLLMANAKGKSSKDIENEQKIVSKENFINKLTLITTPNSSTPSRSNLVNTAANFPPSNKLNNSSSTTILNNITIATPSILPNSITKSTNSTPSTTSNQYKNNDISQRPTDQSPVNNNYGKRNRSDNISLNLTPEDEVKKNKTYQSDPSLSNSSSLDFQDQDFDRVANELERHLEDKYKQQDKREMSLSKSPNRNHHAPSNKEIFIVRINTNDKNFTRDNKYFKMQKKELDGITIKSTNDDGKGTLYLYVGSKNEAERVVQSTSFFNNCQKMILDVNRKPTYKVEYSKRKSPKDTTQAILTGLTLNDVLNNSTTQKRLEEMGMISFDPLSETSANDAKAIKVKFRTIEKFADALKEDNGWFDLKIDQEIRRVRVKPELPPVMQCKNCGHLSHWTSDCDTCTLCLDCGGLKNGHGPTCTQAKSCINCGGDHGAFAKSDCVPYKKIQNEMVQKKINQILNAMNLGHISDDSQSTQHKANNRGFSSVVSQQDEIRSMAEKQSKLEEKSDKILNAILETKEQNSQMLTACQNSINSNTSLKAEVETLTSSVNNLLKSIREVVRDEINQTWSHKEAEIDLKITTSKNDILNYVSNNFVSKNAQNISAYNNTYTNNSHYSNHQNNNQSSSNMNNSMSY